MKPIRIDIAVAAIIFTASGLMVWAQRSGGGNVPSQPAPTGTGSIPSKNSNRSGFPIDGRDTSIGPMGMPDPISGRLAAQQEKTRNNERHRKVISDTDRLVGLVNELKTQMDAEKTLSPAEISKRAEEIEKLARSVKDKMKG